MYGLSSFMFIRRCIPMVEKADLKSVGLIACGFDSRHRYQPGKYAKENWELRRGLNYQIVQGSVHDVEWLSISKNENSMPLIKTSHMHTTLFFWKPTRSGLYERGHKLIVMKALYLEDL